ncbi:MAG: InlB B-repeat-containing protein, partial [Clostridium sp.]|nr:InlB B-repeat-containing protein [Clostridium sp.]
MGSWNNGNFFETITYELVGFDDEAMTMKYRFRYYITHKGGSGSYIYQKVPVGVFLDNKKIATFSSWIDKHISNKTQLCGEKTVTIKSGTHVVELRDIKDGAITVVNVTKSVHIPIPSYTVRFLDQDGTVLKTQTVERYKDAEAPPVSDKTGKTFTGWDKSFHYVREDLVITAQYATNTYSVNFIDWNGNVLKSQSVKHGESASPPPSPSREGHTFQGWIGDYTNVTGNRTITASYKILTFTITFDSNGGTPVSSQVITYGDKAGYPA